MRKLGNGGIGFVGQIEVFWLLTTED
jgi:hypothetical protein